MTGNLYPHLGNRRCWPEGVGSYATPVSLTSSHFIESFRDSAGIVYDPKYTEIESLTPRRNGQGLVFTDEDVTYGIKSRMRAITIPSSDAGARPSNSHPLFRGGGAIEVYSNNGGAGPYTLTYSWLDAPEAMDSLTFSEDDLHGTGSNAMNRIIAGGRHNLKISGSKGGEVMIEAVGGKAKTYTESDKGSGPAADDTPSGQILLAQGMTLTLTNIGATLAYSGPLESFEFDLGYEVVVVKSGTESSGIITEVLLIARPAIKWTLTIQDQLRASFNARKVRDDQTTLTAALQIPDLSDSDNTCTFNWDGQIRSVAGAELASGVKASKIEGVTMWPDASTPGITPVASFNCVFSTAA